MPEVNLKTIFKLIAILIFLAKTSKRNIQKIEPIIFF